MPDRSTRQEWQVPAGAAILAHAEDRHELVGSRSQFEPPSSGGFLLLSIQKLPVGSRPSRCHLNSRRAYRLKVGRLQTGRFQQTTQ